MSLIGNYRALHASNPGYGSSSIKRLPYILPYVRLVGARTVIDYGCGQSELADHLAFAAGCVVTRYDPAIPEYAEKPASRFDMLICVDVLEHVPEFELDAVLRDMASLSDKAVIVVDTKPARMLLCDGTNAHVTLRTMRWWWDKLKCYYPSAERISVSRRPASFRTWNIGLVDRAHVRASAAFLNAGRMLSRLLRSRTKGQGTARCALPVGERMRLDQSQDPGLARGQQTALAAV